MEARRLGGDTSPVRPAVSFGNVRIEDFKVIHHFRFSLSLSLFTLIIVPETFKFRGAPVFDLRL